MATKYVVLEVGGNSDGAVDPLETFAVINTVEAPNAEAARRIAAGALDDDALEQGVDLIAVPERNWRTGRGTLKAETQRRIRSV